MKSIKFSNMILNMKYVLPFIAIVPLQKIKRSNLLFCKESSIENSTVLENLGKIDSK